MKTQKSKEKLKELPLSIARQELNGRLANGSIFPSYDKVLTNNANDDQRNILGVILGNFSVNFFSSTITDPTLHYEIMEIF